MRSFTQALNLFTTSLGAWLCIPLIYFVNINKNNQWLPADVNEGHLANYFALLAVIMLVDLLLFIKISQTYEYKVRDLLPYGFEWGSSGSDSIITHCHFWDSPFRRALDLSSSCFWLFVVVVSCFLLLWLCALYFIRPWMMSPSLLTVRSSKAQSLHLLMSMTLW